MKNLMVMMMVLGTTTAFANCNVSLTQWGVNGSHLSDVQVSKQVRTVLEDRGYTLSQDSNADYNLHLHYYGMISESGRSKTVGTVLTLSSVVEGQKNSIASARSERFIGSARGISKSTLRQNISKLSDSIPSCL